MTAPSSTPTPSPFAMALLAAFGAALLAFVVWRVPETVRSRNAQATQWRPLLAQLGRTLAHPAFRAWTLVRRHGAVC